MGSRVIIYNRRIFMRLATVHCLDSHKFCLDRVIIYDCRAFQRYATGHYDSAVIIYDRRAFSGLATVPDHCRTQQALFDNNLCYFCSLFCCKKHILCNNVKRTPKSSQFAALMYHRVQLFHFQWETQNMFRASKAIIKSCG